MRLPWISRQAYDDALSACRDMQSMLNAERNRFDRLLDKFAAMKQEGFTVPSPVTPRVQKEADPLTQAVLEASKGKPVQVRNAMMKQLHEDRNNPLLEETDILRRIESGFSSDDVGLPE